MNKSFLSFLLIGTLVTACNNEDESDATDVPTNTAVPMSSIPSTPADSAKASTNTTAEQPSTIAALNPPHGQLGHRCDIAVGAPLNSASGANAPTTLQAPTPTLNIPAAGTSAAKQSGTSRSGRINPPHGQPGHDCNVQVGQPLN